MLCYNSAGEKSRTKTKIKTPKNSQTVELNLEYGRLKSNLYPLLHSPLSLTPSFFSLFLKCQIILLLYKSEFQPLLAAIEKADNCADVSIIVTSRGAAFVQHEE